MDKMLALYQRIDINWPLAWKVVAVVVGIAVLLAILLIIRRKRR